MIDDDTYAHLHSLLALIQRITNELPLNASLYLGKFWATYIPGPMVGLGSWSTATALSSCLTTTRKPPGIFF
jgi:hypothetical protein